MTLFTFIFMTIAGTFFGIIAEAQFDDKPVWQRVLIFVSVSVAFGAIATGAFTLDAKIAEETWNGGRCECGGEWDFVNATKNKQTTYYFYECEDCKKIIEMTQKRG